MNLNEIRTRANAFTSTVLDLARDRAVVNTARFARLKASLKTLSLASRDLRDVAKRHGSRLIEQNASIAKAASGEISALAANTYTCLVEPKPARTNTRARKTSAGKTSTRKRAASKAA